MRCPLQGVFSNGFPSRPAFTGQRGYYTIDCNPPIRVDPVGAGLALFIHTPGFAIMQAGSVYPRSRLFDSTRRIYFLFTFL